jgi:hypothetical protein
MMQVPMLKRWQLSLVGTLIVSSAIASDGEYAFAQQQTCKPKYSQTGQLIGCVRGNSTINPTQVCLRRLPNGDCVPPRPDTAGLTHQSNPKAMEELLKRFPQAIQQLQQNDPQAIQKLREGDPATLQKLQQIAPETTQILQPYFQQKIQTPVQIHRPPIRN